MERDPGRFLRPPVIDRGLTLPQVDEKIGSIVLSGRTPWQWWMGFAFFGALTLLLVCAIGYLFAVGVGIWGINIPVGWGFAIINFVWWIGIGHAGTLISAILLLLQQRWRTSINRFAEAMTLFAVLCAGLFPLLHLGRPWLFYWMIPYPNTMDMWPQFRSPLVWDLFAVFTYFTISLLFWYVGLIPDLATLRDRASGRHARRLFGLFALGWRGSAYHWRRYQSAYLLLAGLATPLVVSVHTVVSFDFSIAIVPGWHSTIFPPYFVAGAIFSGFAMVLSIAIPLRAFFGLKGLLTERHLDNMAKLMLATGLVVAYGYVMEGFMTWYSGNPFEIRLMRDRAFGSYAPALWGLLLCNVIIPQALWSRRVRLNMVLLWLIALAVNVGMWLERLIIVVVSLHRDYLPSSWGTYWPTFWDWATFLGTIGLFTFLFFLFIRLLPMISMSEVKELLHEEEHAPEGGTR